MTHAILSPSAAHRWMNCTKSARLEEKFEDTPSDAALEGTIAHALCAELLIELVSTGTFNEENAIEGVCHSCEGFTPSQFDEWYDADMIEFAQQYALFVWDAYQRELKSTPDAVLMIEKKIDASMYGKDMAGTTDAAIVSDKVLHIFDFKYGRGVKVEAEGNPQMRIYALGNIEQYGGMYAFKDVKETIYQPRIGNISTEETTVAELRVWGHTQLKPAAELAYDDKGEFKAGPWCKFCNAKALCRAEAEHCTAQYHEDAQKSADTLSDTEIAEIIGMSEEITSWLDAVKQYASTQLLSGHDIKGLKLVEGRSLRRYADETKVVDALHANGFKDEQIFDRRLKTLTAMQKTLTKNVFDAVLGALIIKPQGAPTLAKETDPRPAYNSAQDDFKNV